MTATQDHVDPFAGGDKTPSLKFPTIGTKYLGLVVTEPPKLLQSTDFETGELAFWPGRNGQQGNPKMCAVINVETSDGEAYSIWATKPSALFTALKDAQRDAGAPIAEGGLLDVACVGEKPNEKNPRLNAQKLYKAKYTPPAPPAATDPFGGDEPPF